MCKPLITPTLEIPLSSLMSTKYQCNSITRNMKPSSRNLIAAAQRIRLCTAWFALYKLLLTYLYIHHHELMKPISGLLMEKLVITSWGWRRTGDGLILREQSGIAQGTAGVIDEEAARNCWAKRKDPKPLYKEKLVDDINTWHDHDKESTYISILQNKLRLSKLNTFLSLWSVFLLLALPSYDCQTYWKLHILWYQIIWRPAFHHFLQVCAMPALEQ
jgi:hypothetical protein